MEAVSVRHAVLLTLGVVAVSFSAIFIREAAAPSLAIAFYRMLFASAMVLPVAVLGSRHRREVRSLSRRQVGIAALSGAFLAGHFATWISSLPLTTVAASVVLVTSSPFFVAMGSRFLFGERAGRAVLIGILVGLVGAAVVSGGDLGPSRRAALGDLLALAGAVFAAGYFLAGRRLRQEISLVAYVSVVYPTCAALLLPVALIGRARLTGFDPKTWGLFVLMAMVAQGLGHTVFNYLLADVEATVVAVSVMGEPVGSALLALAFFGEVPPWTAVGGGALILAGIYVAVTAQARERRRPPVALPLE